MSWEKILKSDTTILKETAKLVQMLRNHQVGSEHQSMSSKDADEYLKGIKRTILEVAERLQ
tara:strand:+ start:2604 stop:2786 length:183 start_codon:yes stop_codon:yes gene_type:complete